MNHQPKRLAIFPILLTLLSLSHVVSAQTTETAALPQHVQQAQQLVVNLRGAEENVYGGGKRHINWEPGHGAARTVCSSFITLLLQHTYGWRNEDFKTWMASTNPEADAYHDAIVDRRGFKRILHATALHPGDILAVKYTDHHVSSNGVEDTGHVMLVCEEPFLINSEKPLIAGTRQYTVTVVDSSASGHGPHDTRYQPGRGLTGGIGQGTLRLYADDQDKIVGYTWSDTPKSAYFTGPSRDIVAGRLTRVDDAKTP